MTTKTKKIMNGGLATIILTSLGYLFHSPVLIPVMTFPLMVSAFAISSIYVSAAYALYLAVKSLVYFNKSETLTKPEKETKTSVSLLPTGNLTTKRVLIKYYKLGLVPPAAAPVDRLIEPPKEDKTLEQQPTQAPLITQLVNDSDSGAQPTATILAPIVASTDREDGPQVADPDDDLSDESANSNRNSLSNPASELTRAGTSKSKNTRQKRRRNTTTQLITDKPSVPSRHRRYHSTADNSTSSQLPPMPFSMLSSYNTRSAEERRTPDRFMHSEYSVGKSSPFPKRGRRLTK